MKEVIFEIEVDSLKERISKELKREIFRSNENTLHRFEQNPIQHSTFIHDRFSQRNQKLVNRISSLARASFLSTDTVDKFLPLPKGGGWSKDRGDSISPGRALASQLYTRAKLVFKAVIIYRGTVPRDGEIGWLLYTDPFPFFFPSWCSSAPAGARARAT